MFSAIAVFVICIPTAMYTESVEKARFYKILKYARHYTYLYVLTLP